MASELEKYVQEKYKKFIKSQWGRSIYRDFLLLLSFIIFYYLAAVMVVFVVAMSKLNHEKIPKQNIYMPVTFSENS